MNIGEMIEDAELRGGLTDTEDFFRVLKEHGLGLYPNQAFRRVGGTLQPPAEALFWSLRETLRDG